MARILLLLSLALGASAQHMGAAREETHLAMPIQKCTNADGCTFLETTAVLDSNWRWTHEVGCTNSSKCNCFLGNVWVNETCSSVEECTSKCAVDGEDVKGYREKYGISVDGTGLINMTFVTHYSGVEGANGTNIGARMYLLDSEDEYKMFNLLNKEFTFTVDASNLPCGLNGAVYFVSMDADGGKSKYATNEAGAKYGTGYCDAQCPHDIKWIAGEANYNDWNPSGDDPNAGTGHYGSCCAELDIWEANVISTQMTVHSCDHQGYYRCEGVECGDNNGKNSSDPGDRFKGECDKNGCDFNPYREGAHSFYGPNSSFTIDSSRPVRVVTQFITSDGTDNGTLKEMRRFYIQDNKTFYNPTPSYGNYTAISEEMCKVQMNNFTDRYDVFTGKGGVAGMGEAMANEMALVFSLWDDHEVGMIWLDAQDPYPVPAGKAGALRGTCNQTSGNYTNLEKYHADAYVLYSDVRYGEIGSTYGPGAPPPPPLCPGGSEDSCIRTCDPTDPTKYLACIRGCDENCPHTLSSSARFHLHEDALAAVNKA
jgi:cellulose 1,4-beta-cellobiosidase